jgi:branched-chain amino acid aminotransferase
VQNISIELTKNPKQKPADQSKLGFGNYFTDHMFLMNYDRENGWHNARIIPYAPIELDPAAMCLHYGQEVFEGLKAYRTQSGEISLFRPDKNMERLNLSNQRMCIPLIDEEFALKALKTLIKIDADWIPTKEGTSLYIRPFIFAIDAHIGVRPANELIFMIILSPVGAYYPQGINPVKIYVESEYVRAVKGGTGFTKTGGNYAASLKAQDEAITKGCAQVLWLDGIERRYVEEVGTMNVFFVIDDEVITPALKGSILGGVTRISCVEILNSWGIKVSQRAISIDEIAKAAKEGRLKEAFGTGTAAVISPIGELIWGEDSMVINQSKIGEISQKLYDTLTGIQWGRTEDKFGWNVKVD